MGAAQASPSCDRGARRPPVHRPPSRALTGSAAPTICNSSAVGAQIFGPDAVADSFGGKTPSVFNTSAQRRAAGRPSGLLAAAVALVLTAAGTQLALAADADIRIGAT